MAKRKKHKIKLLQFKYFLFALLPCLFLGAFLLKEGKGIKDKSLFQSNAANSCSNIKIIPIGDSFAINSFGDGKQAGYQYLISKLSLPTFNFLADARFLHGEHSFSKISQDIDTIIREGAQFVIIWGGPGQMQALTDNYSAQISAIQGAFTKAHDAGIKVVALNLPPYGTDPGYTANMQTIINNYNSWIRGASGVDYFIDAYNILVSPDGSNKTRPEYLVGNVQGDNWHINGSAGVAISSAIYSAVNWQSNCSGTTPGPTPTPTPSATPTLSANKGSGSAPLTVDFTIGNGANCINYECNTDWRTNDFVYEKSFRCVYATAGNYTASMSCNGTKYTQVIAVDGTGGTGSPNSALPNLSVDKASGASPMTVNFKIEPAQGSTYTCYNYLCNTGWGASVYTLNQSFVCNYTAPGVYTASIECGGNKIYKAINVSASAANAATLSADVSDGTAPTRVNFTINPNGTNCINYNCGANWRSGSWVIDKSFICDYSNVGNYTASIECGGQIVTKNITITAPSTLRTSSAKMTAEFSPSSITYQPGKKTNSTLTWATKDVARLYASCTNPDGFGKTEIKGRLNGSVVFTYGVTAVKTCTFYPVNSAGVEGAPVTATLNISAAPVNKSATPPTPKPVTIPVTTTPTPPTQPAQPTPTQPAQPTQPINRPVTLPAATVSANFSPTTITYPAGGKGNSALSWSTTNASKLFLSCTAPEAFAKTEITSSGLNGSVPVSYGVTANKTCTFYPVNSAGVEGVPVTVALSISPAPVVAPKTAPTATVSANFSPAAITYPAGGKGNTTLSWSTTNTNKLFLSCTAPEAFAKTEITSSGLSGRVPVSYGVTANKSCTFYPVNSAGVEGAPVTATLSISQATAPVAPTASVQASFSPNIIRLNGKTTLQWSTSNATKLELECSGPIWIPRTSIGLQASGQVQFNTTGREYCTFYPYNANGKLGVPFSASVRVY